MTQFSLHPFRDRADLPPLQIEGNIERKQNRLYLNCSLMGELKSVEVPSPSSSPRRQNELWKETCFEFFLGIKDSPVYWEFNLSPAGHWNGYRFESYRQGMKEEAIFSTLPFAVAEKKDCLTLNLEVSLNSLVPVEQELDAAITAVVKLKDGEITYWALTHCGSKADFHLRDSFMIEL
ncbi:MAG: DOMON-like domain-containing protein [Cyanobacteriota bacterium]|nr:DOMON-like domain-containing protein [Cyanobacteriota bacterium]